MVVCSTSLRPRLRVLASEVLLVVVLAVVVLLRLALQPWRPRVSFW